ncbi:MAG: DNA polymerase III subunit epsilon [Magnetococcales bacterium]|nr:DNA polymerase III subunit epsilon [Magnetococcales bacterium]
MTGEEQTGRVVVLDTETTGLSPQEDRIVEIGCVELLGKVVGEEKQWYLNPERPIPEEASRIHGITDAMVMGKPRFGEIVREFLKFIGDSPLVIHNASFDLGFLNAELKRVRKGTLAAERAIDTMVLARRRFPGAAANLDALCRRLGVDNSTRTRHGALVDAHLLAQVYVLLEKDDSRSGLALAGERKAVAVKLDGFPARQWPVPPGEEQAHEQLLDRLDLESGGSIWRRLMP